MVGRTHDLAAFTALIIIFIFLPSVPEMSILTLILVIGSNFIGGLFPDIDQQTSDFWDNFRLGPQIAKILVPAFGGHRNFSHSIIGTGLIGYGSYALLGYLSKVILLDIDFLLVWYSFMIGLISHIFMDLPTKAGVPLLWPLKWTFGIPPIKSLRITSGKFIEKFIIFPTLLILTLYLVYEYQDKFLYFFNNNLR